MKETKSWIILLLLSTFILHVCCQRVASPQAQLHDVNICEDESALRCQDGERIEVAKVTCGSDPQRACAPAIEATVRNLCDHLQTCSHQGLADVVAPLACDSPVHIRFYCQAGKTPTCQTNICAGASNGLECFPGNVIHVRHMTCLTSGVAEECPRSSYSTLYLCEGNNRCDASGLRDLLPQLCRKSDDVTRAALVQYYCVPESQVDTSCSTGRYHRLKGPFGVIRPPRLDAAVGSEGDLLEDTDTKGAGSNPAGTATPAPNGKDTKDGNGKKKKGKRTSPPRCKWLINPRADKIEVRVHQLTATSAAPSTSASAATASFSSSAPQCPDPGLILLKYRDCGTGKNTVLTICSDEGGLVGADHQHLVPPVEIVSCGMVQLTSAVPGGRENEASVDKLIVSYHKLAQSSDNDVPDGVSSCPAPTAPLPTLESITTDISSPVTFDMTAPPGPLGSHDGPHQISRDSGSSGGSLDSEVLEEEETSDDNSSSPSSPFKKFKLLILYIIFGVVILALIIALIVVIVSYHRISSRKTRRRGDSGERTALWLQPRNEDTPLDTFQTNSLADGSASLTPGSEASHRKVLVSVHHEPETNGNNNRGSGISSFLSAPGNEEDRNRDSTGLKDLIASFQSGTFTGYSSLRDMGGPGKFSTGSLESRGGAVEYELTDKAPAVIGGSSYMEGGDVTYGGGTEVGGGANGDVAGRRSGYEGIGDDGPMYVSAGSGHYAGVAGSDYYEGLPPGEGLYQGIGGESESDYQGIGSGSDSHYASPTNGHYAQPSNGHYEGIGGQSGHYQSTSEVGSGHYEPLPCGDSNIYEAIESRVPAAKEGAKKHKKTKRLNTPAATVPNHQQLPPAPPPLLHTNGRPRNAPLDDFHYLINNDEYAVVRKPQPSAVSSSKSSYANLGRQGFCESPFEEMSAAESTADQNWKRRSAPIDMNSSWTKGEQWDEVV